MSTAAFDVPYPPPPLTAPTSGIPISIALAGVGPTVNIQLWRRRTIVAPWPIPRPGATPRASLTGPLPTQRALHWEPEEVVTLTAPNSTAPAVPYACFCEDLSANPAAWDGRPWIQWRLVPPFVLATRQSIVMTGGLLVGSSAAVTIDAYGVPHWSA